MNHRLFLIFYGIASTLSTYAQESQPTAATTVEPAQADALTLIRRSLDEGAPAVALTVCKQLPPGAEADYWRGRSLLALQRYAEAATYLAKVSADHPLHPYAAKALIYCAGKTPIAADYLLPLCEDSDSAIAAMAKIALAEHSISIGQAVDIESLKAESAHQAELADGLLLLEAEQLRQQGQYDAAIAKCKQAENSLYTRHREYSRLLLAEVYYDKEKHHGSDEGKGEETLLKFVSSHPDSQLLAEAFRRLEAHQAFTTSKYAVRKLEEWSKDREELNRALLATALLQREALLTHENTELGELITNRATGINTDYLPITVQMNNQQAKYHFNHGDTDSASTYLQRIPQNKRDAYTHFYAAQMHAPTSPEAVAEYLTCAASAPPELECAALCNALYCAHLQNNTELCHSIVSSPDYTPELIRALKLTYAGLNLRKAPAESRQLLQEVLAMEPTYEQKVEAYLQLTQLDLDEQQSPAALEKLSTFTHEERTTWPNPQVMRYYGLYLHALECEQEAGRTAATHKPFLLSAMKSTKREDVRTAITLKLAKIHSEEGDHLVALRMLEELAASTNNRELRARALLLAGRESTQCLTYPSVLRGAELFDAASKIDSPYRYRAAILNTAVLFRVGKVEEATLKLNRIIREIETQRAQTAGSTHLAEEYAFALTVLADIEAIPGDSDSLQKAINTNEKIFGIPGLTQAWHNRVYLQQAIFCTRTEKNERALLNYNNIINSLPASTKQATPDQVYILSLAGTGAIGSLLKLQRWEEAALTAEKIVDHPISTVFPKQTEHFKDWAKQIRKTHYLPPKAAH